MATIDTQRSVPTVGYRNYVLFMLALSYAFSYMDRQIVSILLGDLKAEFALNDTQLGLLSGLAFALFYSTLAIPIARFADRSNRVNIISVAIALWSVVTALCGAAQNFLQLFLARIGVGVGEAGGLSPAHSVISDYFDDHGRPLALSLFSLGAAFGAMMGLVVGGQIAENYGWRWAFVVAGVPGILFAVLFKLSVREPQRGRFDSHAASSDREPFMDTVKQLIKNKPYLGIYVGHLLVVFTGYSISAWLPELMLRTYDASKTDVGRVIGLVFFVGTAGGMLAGGALATYFSRFDRRWQIRFPVIGLVLALPLYWLALNAASLNMAGVFFCIGLFCFNMQHGPTLAVVQSAVEPHQRATAASLVFFASNLLGLGLGPLLVGAISDALKAQYGDATSLAIALGSAIAVSIPAIIIFYRTSRYLAGGRIRTA